VRAREWFHPAAIFAIGFEMRSFTSFGEEKF
jgi:hypothetical protein